MASTSTQSAPRVTHGIILFAIAGWMCCGMVALAVVVSVLSTGPSAGLIAIVMPTVLFGCIGYLFLRHFYRTRRFRLDALAAGRTVEGEVAGHGRAFNLFSSTRHHTLRVRYRDSTGADRFEQVIVPGARLAACPPGSPIIGYIHPSGRSYFPQG
ncbi:hypothetical protein HT102_09345 [Hoyosella sp. G463]|uniref:DUF3592 domain-containing protein n=1 Tax=Lolliginicoccus lacisalsi TaxID=2742202 RepID=A0A927PL35_9ACTN|nr:hypothetical protein [Lolliginicoccus lacisalsi]MBD8506690.1 hypothetical protein [Lolliginicoccus lacisalsi]